MSGAKTAVVYGLYGNVESAYKTMPALTSSHSLQLCELPSITDDWAFDGARDNPPGSGDSQIRPAPSGRIIAPVSFKFEARGAGAAYSSSVKSRELSLFARIGGFTETLDATGGSEKYTYNLTAPWAAPSSGAFEAYCRATTTGNIEKWPIVGAYADLSLNIEGGRQGIWTADVQGTIDTDQSEVAWPTFSYLSSLVPVASPLSLSINSVTSLVVRSLNLKIGRGVQARFPDHNAAGGHAGFHPGRRGVMLTALVEKPLFATFNGHALRKAATVVAGSFQVGTVQYGRQRFTLAQMQCVGCKDSEDDQMPLQELIFTAHASTPVANDSLVIVTD